MKFSSFFLIAILFLQGFAEALTLNDAPGSPTQVEEPGNLGSLLKKSPHPKISNILRCFIPKSHIHLNTDSNFLTNLYNNTQIAVMNAQEDAASHQERMCAIAHVKLVARDAIACRQELMATKMCVPAMLINEHTEISPSVLR
ncbi:Hypothetical predicted protein [Olea europaea subsp. europaea]|uniref:Uncharacterized protein n=1 Tax=Olea europaea subsp. europaea TaxID=158383 RepID=A0A8S0VFZ6_OLEEU|nr:Hypothetical predicted protein [Olea europaea subsp. europaea]